MATRSDQIQADIARTRARMGNRIDDVSYGRSYDRSGGSMPSSGGLVEQVRQNPLLAAGLSLVAAALLQDYFGDSQSTGTRVTSRGSAYPYSAAPQPSTQVAGAARQAVGATADAVGSVAGATADAAGNVVDTAKDVVGAVADRATDMAGSVVDTATGAARQVAHTTGDVAEYVADTAGNAAGQVADSTGDLVSYLNDQIRRRPLVSLGLALAGGSLLSNYFGQGSTGTNYGAYSAGGTVDAYGRASSYGAYNPGARAVPSAGYQASSAVRQAADATGDAAGSVVDTATGAARQVADTAGDAATYVADTAGDAATYVADTAGDAATYVADTVTNLPGAVNREVQERPLMALGAAIAAGMLLQPTLLPSVSRVSEEVRGALGPIGSGISEVFTLPEQPEARRITETLVPAAVERAREFTGHGLRDYLDESLTSVVGQSSLRAGVVAAATEKAEALVDRRLPDFLERNLSGTRGLVLLALAGAALQASNEAQQGQGQTLTNIRANLANSLVQTSRAQLTRYFPEFRQQYESTASQSDRRCPNCNKEVPANAQFCPSCGMKA